MPSGGAFDAEMPAPALLFAISALSVCLPWVCPIVSVALTDKNHFEHLLKRLNGRQRH